MKKQTIEKKIEKLNDLYRDKKLAHESYLTMIIPLIDDYLKCEDLSLQEKMKMKGLKTALHGLQFLFKAKRL